MFVDIQLCALFFLLAVVCQNERCNYYFDLRLRTLYQNGSGKENVSGDHIHADGTNVGCIMEYESVTSFKSKSSGKLRAFMLYRKL